MVAAWEHQPAPSTSKIIQWNLSDFWTTFDPSLDAPTPEDIFPEDDYLAELRWRSAPRGTGDWEVDEDDDPEEDPLNQPDDPDSETSSIVSEQPDDTSVLPLRLHFHPGHIHLLNPTVHKIDNNSTYSVCPVQTVPPLRLRSQDADWYFQTMTTGVHLPRPLNAPKTFKVTCPSPIMDSVVDTWVANGLLERNPNLKYAQAMFVVPKRDNKVRPIVDYSHWTEFITTPRFSLLLAGSAIRKTPLGNSMIKIDLTSGFHKIPLSKSCRNHNGISYRGIKYSLTRYLWAMAMRHIYFRGSPKLS